CVLVRRDGGVLLPCRRLAAASFPVTAGPQRVAVRRLYSRLRGPRGRAAMVRRAVALVWHGGHAVWPVHGSLLLGRDQARRVERASSRRPGSCAERRGGRSRPGVLPFQRRLRRAELA